MKLIVKRKEFKNNATFGVLFVDGERFCDTLEPTDRAIEESEIKVFGKTAIPIGEYTFRIWYSPTFKCDCLRLEKVPYFTDILLHPGNYVDDTHGCILVGKKHGDMIINSRDTLAKLIEKVKQSGKIQITR